MRLDVYLHKSGMISSRSRAANLIEMGRVTLNGVEARKPSAEVSEKDRIEITENYEASLGGIKLSHALKTFEISPDGKICLDVGAANGGFTDVLLSSGAKKVYALDVGECALPDNIRNNERVKTMERTNIRNVIRDNFDEIPEFIVIDVSFISLTLVLPVIKDIITPGGTIVALIKPQFEVSKKDLTKKGLLVDEKKRKAAIDKVTDCCAACNLAVKGLTEIPRIFSDKNREYLLYLISE